MLGEGRKRERVGRKGRKTRCGKEGEGEGKRKREEEEESDGKEGWEEGEKGGKRERGVGRWS